MRQLLPLLLVVLIATSINLSDAFATPSMSSVSCTPAAQSALSYAGHDYVIVGGQSGTWFAAGQHPKLYQVYLANGSSVSVPTFPGDGTIWGGAGNGTTYLVSGWGNDEHGANPPILLYDDELRSIMHSTEPNSNSSWYGGDVFAASYNGHKWLLSGMGSGALGSFNGGVKSNHMSLALFDGATFTDLSNLIPRQHWGILYSNAWNGQYWLVGGGYSTWGRLFMVNGTELVDLTTQIQEVVPTFGVVTSVAWNGHNWLIGGYNFLAEYDGQEFADLSEGLQNALGLQITSAVNGIAWNGSAWLLAGGMPKAITQHSNIWIATLKAGVVTDLSSQLPCYIKHSNASILTASYKDGLWVLGGYAGKRPLLMLVQNNQTFDISKLANGMTYVMWVEIAAPQQHQKMQY